MARVTGQFGFGVVAPSLDPRAVASVLNDLSSADIDQMKRRSAKAREVLNANTELGKLVSLYKDLL